jgi:hypothetical protein
MGLWVCEISKLLGDFAFVRKVADTCRSNRAKSSLTRLEYEVEFEPELLDRRTPRAIMSKIIVANMLRGEH